MTRRNADAVGKPAQQDSSNKASAADKPSVRNTRGSSKLKAAVPQNVEHERGSDLDPGCSDQNVGPRHATRPKKQAAQQPNESDTNVLRLAPGRQASASKHAAEDSSADDEEDQDHDAHPLAKAGAESDGDGTEGDALDHEEEPEPSTSHKTRTAATQHGKRSYAHMIAQDLDEQALKQLMAEQSLRNASHKCARLHALEKKLPLYRMQLRANYSLLFYGFGSKMQLLETFARDVLTDGGVVVFNGCHADLTAKTIIQVVAGMLPHGALGRTSAADMLQRIHDYNGDEHIYVVLHNIDGPGLRAPEEQALLAELVACPHIHLAASADHINAALLWPLPLAARFRWLWCDATTLMPYITETLDVPPILAGSCTQRHRAGAATSLRSMLGNAREVFRLLAEYQLDDPDCEGASFKLLFRMCQERFLLKAEQALRSHLTEFKDHELIKYRMATDGSEVMYIPMEPDMLRKVLEQMDAE